jgi:hypothetical protein
VFIRDFKADSVDNGDRKLTKQDIVRTNDQELVYQAEQKKLKDYKLD